MGVYATLAVLIERERLYHLTFRFLYAFHLWMGAETTLPVDLLEKKPVLTEDFLQVFILFSQIIMEGFAEDIMEDDGMSHSYRLRQSHYHSRGLLKNSRHEGDIELRVFHRADAAMRFWNSRDRRKKRNGNGSAGCSMHCLQSGTALEKMPLSRASICRKGPRRWSAISKWAATEPETEEAP